MAHYHERQYDVTVFLGDPDKLPIWKWQVWNAIDVELDKLLRSERGATGVRCIQWNAVTKQYVKFGRLGWNSKSRNRWLHNPETNKDSGGWQFHNLEVWAPNPTICLRENTAPDVFFSVHNEKIGAAYRRTPLFNPVVILAAATNAADKRLNAEEVTRLICKSCLPKLVARRIRPWGIDIYGDSKAFTFCIQDFPHCGLFADCEYHDRHLGTDMFAEEWSVLTTD